MKASKDVQSASLDEEYKADIAYLEATRDRQLAELKAMQPARIFDEAWFDDDRQIHYDFEVIGTGMSLREWEANNEALFY